MIFPIGDDKVIGGAKPIFSYLLIFINIAVYLFMYTSTGGNNAQLDFLYDEYGAKPCEILVGMDLYTIFTSMFMHGSFLHLLGNIVFLWIFGDNIEATIGNIRFIIFYVITGIIAVYIHSAMGSNGNCIPMVGASGAIAGLMGAYLVMFPKSRIKMLFFFFTQFSIPAFIFLGLWILQEIGSSVTNFNLIKETRDGGVAHFAHVGGFICGVAAGYYFKKYRKLVFRDRNSYYIAINKNEPL